MFWLLFILFYVRGVPASSDIQKELYIKYSHPPAVLPPVRYTSETPTERM